MSLRIPYNEHQCPVHQIPLVEYHKSGYEAVITCCLECDFTLEALQNSPLMEMFEQFKTSLGMKNAEASPEVSLLTNDDKIIGFNPYLDDVLSKYREFELWDMSFQLRHNVKYLSTDPSSIYLRDMWVFKYSWAIPRMQILQSIKEFAPIIEIGAGSGYWAYLLDKMGCDIKAFDNHDAYYKVPHSWFDVDFGEPEVLENHPNRTLFLCWPPMSDMAFDCLKNYEGAYVIYVGEGHGGCTANEEFFELLEERFEEHHYEDMLVWPNIRDYFAIYKRK